MGKLKVTSITLHIVLLIAKVSLLVTLMTYDLAY